MSIASPRAWCRHLAQMAGPLIECGNYICTREGLTPATPDPVTGSTGQPSGPDCRELNPDGECEHYGRGMTSGEKIAVTVISVVLIPYLALAALALVGVL